jgi:hypothetical protein
LGQAIRKYTKILNFRRVFMVFDRARFAILGPPCAILGHLGAILGTSWGYLEATLGHLGPSWSHLGAILGHLGPSWGHLRAILGHLGAILGPSRSTCQSFWASWVVIILFCCAESAFCALTSHKNEQKSSGAMGANGSKCWQVLANGRIWWHGAGRSGGMGWGCLTSSEV